MTWLLPGLIGTLIGLALGEGLRYYARHNRSDDINALSHRLTDALDVTNPADTEREPR